MSTKELIQEVFTLLNLVSNSFIKFVYTFGIQNYIAYICGVLNLWT